MVWVCVCVWSLFLFFFSFVLLWSRFEFLVAGFVFLVAGFDLGRTRRTLGLCLCLVSVSFLLLFRLCCCDLGLSFWLLDLLSWLLGLIREEHEEQVIMFLWKIIMISNNVLLLGCYSFAWVWFGGDLLKKEEEDWNKKFILIKRK